MPLRDEFAAMVREARRQTGLPLRAAMTLTVTQDNLPQIADVVRWLVRNRDAFSLVSFQPLAQVGRTRKSQRGVTATELWREVARATAGFGLPLDGAGPMHFGHTECTRFVPLIALERPGEEPRLFRGIRDEPEDVAVMEEFFAHGLGGVAFRDDLPLEKAGPLPRHGAHRSGLDARPGAPLDRRPARAEAGIPLPAWSSTACAGGCGSTASPSPATTS